MRIANLEKSVLLNTTNDILDIAAPIRNHFDIKYFGYIKTYSDSTHLSLSTSAEWMKCFYENFHPNGNFHKTMDAYHSGYFLWSQLPNQLSVNTLHNHFNISHGIIIIKKYLDYCEFFGFAADPANHCILNWYLNNIDLLENFILYFKDKSKHLLQSAESDRLILPKQARIDLSDRNTNSVEEARISFLKETAIKNPHGLSNRQFACVYYFAKGMTLKEIAKQLSISPKTVEHYLNFVKTKWKCRSRYEITKKFFELN